MAQCKRMLPNGERCSNRAVPSTDYCEQHERAGRIQFRPVSKVPEVTAPPTEEKTEEKPPPEWVARPSAAGERPAFPGLRADERNILVAPRGCIWLSAEEVEDQPAPLFERLVRLLSALSQEMALPDQVTVRMDEEQGALIELTPPHPDAPDLSRLYDAASDAAAFSGGLLYVGEGPAFIQYRDGGAPRGYTVDGEEIQPPSAPRDRRYLVDREGTHPLSLAPLPEQPLDRLLLRIAPLPAMGAALPAVAYALVAPSLYRMLARYFRAHHLDYRVARFHASKKENVPEDDEATTYLLFEIAPRPDAPTGALLPAFVLSYLEDLPRCAVLTEVWARAGRRLLVEWRRDYPCHPPHVLEAFPSDSLLLFTAGPDFDNLCVSPAPIFFEGDDLTAAHAPQSERADLTARDDRAGLPLDLPVRLTIDQGPLPPTAALILEGQEIAWLRRLLYRLPGEAFAGYTLCLGRERAVLVGEGLPLEIASLPFGIPLRRVRDTQLFIPLRARFTPDLPWALLAEALALQTDTYTFLAPDFRLDVSCDEFAPLSRALTAEPGRPRVALKMRQSSDLPALRFTPPEEPTEEEPSEPEPSVSRPDEAPSPQPDERGEKAGLLRRILGDGQPVPEQKPMPTNREVERVVVREVEAQDLEKHLREEAESYREDGNHLDAALYFALAGDIAAAGQCYQRGANNASEE